MNPYQVATICRLKKENSKRIICAKKLYNKIDFCLWKSFFRAFLCLSYILQSSIYQDYPIYFLWIVNLYLRSCLLSLRLEVFLIPFESESFFVFEAILRRVSHGLEDIQEEYYLILRQDLRIVDLLQELIWMAIFLVHFCLGMSGGLPLIIILQG